MPGWQILGTSECQVPSSNQAPNSKPSRKFQGPTSNSQRSSKSQAANPCQQHSRIGIWNLELLRHLELGTWNFSVTSAAMHNPEKLDMHSEAFLHSLMQKQLRLSITCAAAFLLVL